MLKLTIGSMLPPRATAEPNVKRTAEQVSAELHAHRSTADALAAKIATARADVEHASRAYDQAISAYAVGNGKQPDRKALDTAIATLDGLRRVAKDNTHAIANLESELHAVQQCEAINSESGALDALITDSESALSAFLQAAAQAKETEARLFALLFDTRTGLNRSFQTSDNTARARKARFEIRDEAIQASEHIGFKINPDFRTNGAPNLGEGDRARDLHTHQLKQDAERAREYYAAERELRRRVDARRIANPEYQHPLYAVGTIVPELEGR